MIPYVEKQNLTIIAVNDVLEATAIRATLEAFNYRTTTHGVGSRIELLELLAGDIPTGDTVIRSCRGAEHGIPRPGRTAAHAGRYPRARAPRRQDHRQPRVPHRTMAPAFLAAVRRRTSARPTTRTARLPSPPSPPVLPAYVRRPAGRGRPPRAAVHPECAQFRLSRNRIS